MKKYLNQYPHQVKRKKKNAIRQEITELISYYGADLTKEQLVQIHSKIVSEIKWKVK
jgi:ribosomal protein S3AE